MLILRLWVYVCASVVFCLILVVSYLLVLSDIYTWLLDPEQQTCLLCSYDVTLRVAQLLGGVLIIGCACAILIAVAIAPAYYTQSVQK